MSEARATLLHALEVTIHTAESSLPSLASPPAAPTSDELAEWKNGKSALRSFLTKLYGSTDAGDVSIAGPVTVIGYHVDDQRWYQFATLNGGGAIAVRASLGWIWKPVDTPAWASAIRLTGGAITGGTITAKVEPLETAGVP